MKLSVIEIRYVKKLVKVREWETRFWIRDTKENKLAASIINKLNKSETK